MTQPIDIKALRKLAEAATLCRWNYEPERYSAKCVIGIKPMADNWIAHFQPEFNGENNGMFVAAANPATMLTLLDALETALEALKSIQRKQLEGCLGTKCTCAIDFSHAALSRLAELGVG